MIILKNGSGLDLPAFLTCLNVSIHHKDESTRFSVCQSVNFERYSGEICTYQSFALHKYFTILNSP